MFALPASAAPSSGSSAQSATAAQAGAKPTTTSMRDGRTAPFNKAAALAGANVPQAVAQDGVCDLYSNGTGEGCQWFFSNFTGSMSDLFFNDTNLCDNFFVTAAAGQGSAVCHNAESVWNRDTLFTLWVYTGFSFTGSAGFVGTSVFGNYVSPWFNGVNSMQWL